MLKSALIIEKAVNQNPASDDVFLESCLLVLDIDPGDPEEFSIRLSTLDDTIYFFLDRHDFWGILAFLEQHGIKRPVAS